jgi:AcrR family transcriptional regulator
VTSRPTFPTGRERGALNRPAIAIAALAILDADGPAALTARALAKHLGCEPMSLYHHVANMDAVRDLVVDQLLGSLMPQHAPSGSAAHIREQAQRFVELAEAHPHPFALIATRRWRLAQGQALANYLVECFALSAPNITEALTNARILGAYMNGAGLALAAWQLSPPINLEDSRALGHLNASFNAAAVKRDLLAGLDQLIVSLVGNRATEISRP